MGVERSFFTPISFWRVLCEWSAVVTAPLMLPSSHDLSLHLQFRHSRQSTAVALSQCGCAHMGPCTYPSPEPHSARPYSKDAVVTAP